MVRFNGSLLNLLRLLVEELQTDWPDHLPAAMLAYRATRRDAIQMPPFQARMGRRARLHVDCKLRTKLSDAWDPEDLQPWLATARAAVRTALHHAARAGEIEYDRKQEAVDPGITAVRLRTYAETTYSKRAIY